MHFAFNIQRVNLSISRNIDQWLHWLATMLKEPTIYPQQRVNGKYHFSEHNRNAPYHCITCPNTALLISYPPLSVTIIQGLVAGLSKNIVSSTLRKEEELSTAGSLLDPYIKYQNILYLHVGSIAFTYFYCSIYSIDNDLLRKGYKTL